MLGRLETAPASVGELAAPFSLTLTEFGLALQFYEWAGLPDYATYSGASDFT